MHKKYINKEQEEDEPSNARANKQAKNEQNKKQLIKNVQEIKMKQKANDSNNEERSLTDAELIEIRIKEQIYNFAKEELEFYEVAKSMKNINIEHSNISDVNIKLVHDSEFLTSQIKANSSTLPKEKPIMKESQMQNYINNVKELYKQKEKLEKLLKQKTNVMKYLDMEAYKKARTNRVMFTFSLLCLIIFGVFMCYSYYKAPLK